MAEVKIQKATIENLKNILELNQKLFDYESENFDKTLDCDWPSRNKEYFKKALESKDRLALVVLIKNKMVGYLIGSLGEAKDYRKIKKIAEIDNMLVLPKYRNQGIGDSLIERFFNWVKERGINRVKVVAPAQNKKAINFYRKTGFLDYNITLETNIK